MQKKEDSNYLEHKQVVPILIGLATGLFLSALDQTIVATAIRTIGDNLHGLSLQVWVTTAYLIASTITTPLYGKFSDIYGRKPLFMIAISTFILGSALCASATSMYQLALYRALQGLGAGGLFTLALAVLGDILPPRERAKYQGMFIAVFGTSSVIGPLVGGFFAGSPSILGITGWRWVFLINVPLGLISLLIVAKTLHIPGFVKQNHAIDWKGLLSLNLSLIPLLLLAERGREWGWASPISITMLLLFIIGLFLFIFAEKSIGDEAIIPLRLFKNKTFSVVALGGLITGAGFFGALLLLPLYLQVIGGASPTKAGLQLLPLTLGIMIGSIICGQVVSKTGRYKFLPLIGSSVTTLALFAMHFVKIDTSYSFIALIALFFGLGMGFLFQPLTVAVQSSVSPRDIGTATASSTLFRQLGGTLGAALYLSLLFGNLGSNISTSFKRATSDPLWQRAASDPTNSKAVANLSQFKSGTLNDTSWLSNANKTLIKPFLEGWVTTQAGVFLIASFIMLFSIATLLFLPDNEVRGRTTPSE